MIRILAALVAAVGLTVFASKPTASVADTRMTEQYVRMVARDAYFWAWPMINVYNRRLAFKQLPEPGLMGGVMPAAPVNRLSMLTNYIQPEERMVACPNQDVVYGASSIALDESPVVIRAGLRQALLGLPGRRSAHRRLRRAGRDVRHEAGVLSARRTELDGRGAEGHLQGVSR